MKKAIALLLVLASLVSGCAKAPPKEAPEEIPEASRGIVPEAAISSPCIYLRVAYATDAGFVGLVIPKPGDHIEEGKEINIVVEDGVEICVPVDEKTGKFVDAGEMTYKPGMLVEVQFTKWIGDTIYPELMYEHDTLWWEEKKV